MSYLIECKNLSKSYGRFNALNNVNLNISEGKMIGLLGPNGSGKTTLIKIANGLLTTTHGEILIDGFKPGVYTKSIVSYLPDKNYLDENLKVKTVIQLFADFYVDFSLDRAHEMIKMLNIDLEQRISKMSKGTKEKVQLILVMSRDAKVYLLDEPIAGVDPAARDYIINTIMNNYNKNSSVILSTHLISDIEPILDEAIFIQNGNIVLHEEVSKIKEKHGISLDAHFREVFKC